MRYAAVFVLTATLLAACNPTPENKAPTVTLAPTAAQSVVKDALATKLTATATDDGTIAKVEFLDGTTVVATDSSAPYEFTPPTTTVGEKTYTAKAFDDKGLTGVSAGVKVTVTAPVAPTTGTLTAPATALVGLEVSLSATATAASGATVTSVEFFDGTTSLGKVTAAPYSVKYTFTTAGAKSITAKITDDKGGVFTTAASTITVGGSARVRAVHASADAPNVDVQVDNTPVPALTNVAFGTFSPYLVLGAKTTNVKVFPTGTTATPVIDANLPLAAGKDYTVLAVGKVTAPATISALVLTDDNTAPATGKVRIRVVHGASAVPNVNVYVTAPGAALPAAADATLKNVAFKDASAYLEVNAGTYQVRVTPATSQTVAIDVPSVPLVAGKIYTAIALDPKAPSTTPTLLLLTDN